MPIRRSKRQSPDINQYIQGYISFFIYANLIWKILLFSSSPDDFAAEEEPFAVFFVVVDFLEEDFLAVDPEEDFEEDFFLLSDFVTGKILHLLRCSSKDTFLLHQQGRDEINNLVFEHWCTCIKSITVALVIFENLRFLPRYFCAS